MDVSEYRPWSVPQRDDQVRRLKDEEFDVLVIGGGCVGTGVALDASTRGLKVALIDQSDWASGTSGRSTKLIHGGIRYLENAFMKLDFQSFKLVDEALAERQHLLKAAEFMAKPVPIMIPLYSWWEVPYMYIGAKVYDLIARRRRFVPPAHYIGKEEALYRFPQLRSDGLKGAVVYYDGMHNDSRMNLLIALTAVENGTVAANYVRVNGLIKAEDGGSLRGAQVQDLETGEEFVIRSRAVVNATGPFADSVRKMEDDDAVPRIVPAAGVHLVLPDYLSPKEMGLIVPKTSDGRVLFFLPWEDSTLCGTTDSETEITMTPRATGEDVRFILDEANRFLAPEHTVLPSHVRAAWSGIRPLVVSAEAAKKAREEKGKGEKESSTKDYTRSHDVEVGPSGLVSILGGKWTTYRSMAQDTVDALLSHVNALGDPSLDNPEHVERVMKAKEAGCKTLGMTFVGSDRNAGWTPKHRYDLIDIALREDDGIDRDTAYHLRSNYGLRAIEIASLISERPELGKKLHRRHPMLRAEVVFAVQQEMAVHALDVIARRTRLAFVDAEAAKEAAPRVIDIMARECGWSSTRKAQELEDVHEFLESMSSSITPSP